jgi:hypothetical protein
VELLLEHISIPLNNFFIVISWIITIDFFFFFIQNNKTTSTTYFNSSSTYVCDVHVLKLRTSKFIQLLLNCLNIGISGPDVTDSFDITKTACKTI